MGLFGNIFGGNSEAKEETSFPWKAVDSEGKLNEIDAVSQEKLCVIFKHSTRCGISKMALRQFEKEAEIEEEKLAFYYLDLINYRSLSQQIAERYQVMHESPQVIFVKNGKVIAHDSHSGIDAEKIKQFV
ncbi:bacillithiol system redox-active protein YtxJ [Mesonia maritima]|uniref:Bacillithiol system protein YtxJ n=1 Tax=Mesonia maritima TaxID=1793873 RepID=A0ABU1KAY0_9FLAO|nr:bacillithiol system redox-active protein YtxJ [Mesonia maritima]MDR6302202.1 bacillithiol system protein YtxJ [Mesonia maritima]